MLFTYLKNLVKDKQKSVVLVLHNLSHAYQYADHVVALQQGKFLAQGEPDNVMNDDNLQTMYQTKIHRQQTENGVIFY